MSENRINATKNYRLFTRTDDNRPLDPQKHKKLMHSMKQYGFLRSFPIVCRKEGNRLVVRDGQHRLAIAETLGLQVYFVIEAVNFDVAVINSTARIWTLKDYAQSYAQRGIAEYQEILDFADSYSIPLGTAAPLLAGTTTFANVSDSYFRGEFKIRDRKWAESVAQIFKPMVAMCASLNRKVFIEACMAVCRVPGFDRERLLQGAERCREKLVAYSTRDACLDMIEDIYNFGRKKLFPIKIEATQVMRERNAITVAKKKKVA